MWIGALAASLLNGSTQTAWAADDSARFYGTWVTSVPVNGTMVTLVSVHDAAGYTNSWRSAAALSQNRRFNTPWTNPGVVPKKSVPLAFVTKRYGQLCGVVNDVPPGEVENSTQGVSLVAIKSPHDTCPVFKSRLRKYTFACRRYRNL